MRTSNDGYKTDSSKLPSVTVLRCNETKAQKYNGNVTIITKNPNETTGEFFNKCRTEKTDFILFMGPENDFFNEHSLERMVSIFKDKDLFFACYTDHITQYNVNLFPTYSPTLWNSDTIINTPFMVRLKGMEIDGRLFNNKIQYLSLYNGLSILSKHVLTYHIPEILFIVKEPSIEHIKTDVEILKNEKR